MRSDVNDVIEKGGKYGWDEHESQDMILERVVQGIEVGEQKREARDETGSRD